MLYLIRKSISKIYILIAIQILFIEFARQFLIEMPCKVFSLFSIRKNITKTCLLLKYPGLTSFHSCSIYNILISNSDTLELRNSHQNFHIVTNLASVFSYSKLINLSAQLQLYSRSFGDKITVQNRWTKHNIVLEIATIISAYLFQENSIWLCHINVTLKRCLRVYWK